mgnify:CR=1 FL=1
MNKVSKKDMKEAEDQLKSLGLGFKNNRRKFKDFKV